MAALRHIDSQSVAGKITWLDIIEAIKNGHQQIKPELGDQILTSGDDLLLSRAAWIEGSGMGVKTVSVMAENASNGLPSVQGAMLVFEDVTGSVQAVIDNDVITYWKTAGDSVLGAQILARPDSKTLLIIGAGVVAGSLVRAYCTIFPGLREVLIWNRTTENAQKLVDALQKEGFPVALAKSLRAVAARSDIISTATLSQNPVLCGDWVKPGAHIDLIGAFTPDMREADDALMQKGRLFVDCKETTIGHIGEIMIPLQRGVIGLADILGDFYDIIPGRVGRCDRDEITIFKNGGGAHLDLMVAKYLISITD